MGLSLAQAAVRKASMTAATGSKRIFDRFMVGVSDEICTADEPSRAKRGAGPGRMQAGFARER
jgi:hypothetical protein